MMRITAGNLGEIRSQFVKQPNQLGHTPDLK
jgi:hypothetical protein